MPTPKYKKYYDLMIDQNKQLFSSFSEVHTRFSEDSDKHADSFHSLGRDVTDTIRFWERKLCAGMERGTNSQYSSILAEKFWTEVRKNFPHIDQVGIKTIKKKS